MRISSSDSQEKARIAALREVGEPVATKPWVVEVLEDSPATDLLKHGDVILSVDGKPVSGPKQMSRIIRAAGPGARLPIDLDVATVRIVPVSVVTVANPDDPELGYRHHARRDR